MKEIKINQNDANQRLDKFLMKTFPKLGKSMMYKAIRNKKIKVNRKRCTFDQKIQENDSILLFLPPDVLEEKKVETNYISSKLDVIYEEELTIPYIDVIRSYIDNVKLEPRTFTEQPMKDIRNIGKLFCEYVTGKITLDDFCVQMQQNVDGK